MTNARLAEPDQSKHGQYCGAQGSHSGGNVGPCTCGRDTLVRALKAIAGGGFGMRVAEKAKRALVKASREVDCRA